VYSTLLFSPVTQTCYSEGEDGLEFFDEEFRLHVARLSLLWSYGVFRCFVSLRVIIVFRDLTYVIIILYS
jgi:hypothetical protein